MLFNMENDPDELVDLGPDPAYSEVIDMMYVRLGQWARRMSQRTTKSEQGILDMRGKSLRKGILPFLYDGTEVGEDLTVKYHGPISQNYTLPEPVE